MEGFWSFANILLGLAVQYVRQFGKIPPWVSWAITGGVGLALYAFGNEKFMPFGADWRVQWYGFVQWLLGAMGTTGAFSAALKKVPQKHQGNPLIPVTNSL